MLKLYLLGSPQIVFNEEWIDLRSAKARALLFYLAVTGRAHSRLALAGLLWPEKSNAEARTNLRQAIYHLHQHIPECLLATRDYIRLNPQQAISVDVRHFEDEIVPVLSHFTHAENRETLSDVIQLYQGEFLDGFFVEEAAPYEEWITAQRERLHKYAFDGLYRLTQNAIKHQDGFKGLRYAQQLVVLEPWNEESHYTLMQILAMTGQTQSALNQYDQCRRLLLEHLGVEPGAPLNELRDSIRRGTVGRFPNGHREHRLPVSGTSPSLTLSVATATPSIPVHRHNLTSPLSSFVGRHRELAELQAIVSATGTRLVSLIGPGGVGKTRLAVHLGRLLTPQFEDGVWFIDLLCAVDGVTVEQAAAVALGIQETAQATLADSLRFFAAHKRMLLVLDNCEHVIEDAARFTDWLLSFAPGVKILATSREPLDISGEQCISIPPLALPRLRQVQSAQAVGAYESVQLFVERAAAHVASFRLDDQNARPIAEICRRLDGIPLAIELVAARIRTLSVKQIAQQLEEDPSAQFQLAKRGRRNSTERHQTLYNLIEWSYQLLPPAERSLFARLAVFAGNWSLTAAEQICRNTFTQDEFTQDKFKQAAMGKIEQESVADLMDSLVDKSLVMVEPGENETRYRFLETIQRFAQGKLMQSGEERRLRDCHLAFFEQFMQNRERPPQHLAAIQWRTQITHSLENIRAALKWAVQSGSAHLGLRLALATGPYWFSQGFHRESVRWIQLLLNMPEAAQEKELRLAALSTIGFTHWWILGDYVTARQQQQEALALAQELGDTERIEKTLNNLGGVALRTGNYAQAVDHLKENLHMTAQSGNKLNRAWASILLGEALLAQARLAEADSHFSEAVQILRSLTNSSLLAYPLRRLGQITLEQGQEIANVLVYYAESLTLNFAAGEIEGRAACIAAYAALFLHVGDKEKATQLCAAVAATLKENQSALSGYDAQTYEALYIKLRNSGETALKEAWAQGKELSLANAVTLIEQWVKEV